MCGIFGLASSQPIAADDFIQLAQANKHRGNLAFGYWQGWLADAGWETAAARYAQPFTPDLAQLSPANPAFASRANLLLGHILAPTGGRFNPSVDVHPLALPDLVMAHNGLLLNHDQFPAWRLFLDSAVDSQFILGGIQAYRQQGLPTAEAVAAAVSQLEGQQACWLWSAADQALYLWRVMAPIYYSLVTPASAAALEARFTFSSSRMEPENITTLLPEGTVFRLDPQTLALEETAVFPFYSPYRI